MPCQNGGTCVTNYKYNTFECHCEKGFIGEYCEKGRLPALLIEICFIWWAVLRWSPPYDSYERWHCSRIGWTTTSDYQCPYDRFHRCTIKILSERTWNNQRCTDFSKVFIPTIRTFAEDLFTYGPRNDQLNNAFFSDRSDHLPDMKTNS